MGDVWFVTGGARSGKSRFAERLAASTGREVVYVATLEPLDAEMEHRVTRHRESRPAAWRTIEAPRDPLTALDAAPAEACVLLDCLSLWVTNLLLDAAPEPDPAAVGALAADVERRVGALLEAVSRRPGPLIVVSNEVGAGIVPEHALGRAFRDLLGWANQQVAASASRAWLLVAGRALELPPPEADVLT
ncbi:MAG: bifunctional adenosylcobinamide kinase/adenosylcobinamide-phosphate guanylyltransferase [Dehalococcoidia bacterium]